MTDPGDDTVGSVVVSCGSGGTLVAGSQTASSLRCVFPDGPASSTVSVRATDSDGDAGAADTQAVTVRNVAPTATLDPGNVLTVGEGSAQRTFSFSVSDPGDDTGVVGGGVVRVRPARWWPGRRRRRASGACSRTGRRPRRCRSGRRIPTVTRGPADTQTVTVRNVAPTATLRIQPMT